MTLKRCAAVLSMQSFFPVFEIPKCLFCFFRLLTTGTFFSFLSLVLNCDYAWNHMSLLTPIEKKHLQTKIKVTNVCSASFDYLQPGHYFLFVISFKLWLCMKSHAPVDVYRKETLTNIKLMLRMLLWCWSSLYTITY